MRHLTYLKTRRRPWTEHGSFPLGAIRAWQKRTYETDPLQIWFIDSGGLLIGLRMTLEVGEDGDEWVQYTDGRWEKLSDVMGDLERITE